jgi:glutamyl/glutaminyl-tRNA synthetase
VLDPIKLDWMNGEYIKKMEMGELHARLAKYLEEHEADFYRAHFSQKNYDFNTKILHELKSRMKRFDEFISLTQTLYGSAPLRKDLLVNQKMKIETEADGISALHFVLNLLENGDFSDQEKLK